MDDDLTIKSFKFEKPQAKELLPGDSQQLEKSVSKTQPIVRDEKVKKLESKIFEYLKKKHSSVSISVVADCLG